MDITLFPSVVISNILGWLPLADKLISRSVCRDWKEMLGEELKSQTKLWLTGIDVENDCKEGGHQVTIMDAVPQTEFTSFNTLRNIVSLCPNLRVVKIDIAPDEYIDGNDFVRRGDYLLEILSRCPLECILSPYSNFTVIPEGCSFPFLRHIEVARIGVNVFSLSLIFPVIESVVSCRTLLPDTEFGSFRKGIKRIESYRQPRGLLGGNPLDTDLQSLSNTPAAETLESIGLIRMSAVVYQHIPFFPRLNSICLQGPLTRSELTTTFENTRRLLQRHSSTLQEVIFEGYAHVSRDQWRQMLTVIPNIKSLGFLTGLRRMTIISRVIQVVFPQLQCLFFRVHCLIFKPSAFPFIMNHQSFPRLKSLTICFWRGKNMFEAWKQEVVAVLFQVAQDMMIHGSLERFSIFFGKLHDDFEVQLTDDLINEFKHFPQEIEAYTVNYNRSYWSKLRTTETEDIIAFKELCFRLKR